MVSSAVGKRTVEATAAKGALLEDIVAMLHSELDGETTKVEKRVKLPSATHPNRTREIDVLITGSIAGYPVRVAVECKNYKKPIGSPKIDEFSGKLSNVGIPSQNGVYVTSGEYTADAVDRARDLGITLLRFEGLTSDHLSSEIHKAIQSTLFVLASAHSFNFNRNTETSEFIEYMFTMDRGGRFGPGCLDMLFAKWKTGEIPIELGEYEVDITPPDGWTWWSLKFGSDSRATATVNVTGLLHIVEGQAERHVLQNVLDPTNGRLRLRGVFAESTESTPLQAFKDEEALEEALNSREVTHIHWGRVRLPRILVANRCYWPPTQASIERIQPRLDELIARGDYQLNGLPIFGFSDFNDSNIVSMWGETWSGYRDLSFAPSLAPPYRRRSEGTLGRKVRRRR